MGGKITQRWAEAETKTKSLCYSHCQVGKEVFWKMGPTLDEECQCGSDPTLYLGS